MARGAKPGERRGGREKGTPNKRTQAREEQMAAASAALEQALANPFTGDSHALLMAIYKNQDLPIQTRLDAAKAAIAYEKPRLAAIEHSASKDSPPLFQIITGVPCDEEGGYRSGTTI